VIIMHNAKRALRLAVVESGIDTFAKLAMLAKINRSRLSLAINGSADLSEAEKDRIASVLCRQRSELFPTEGR
jgi:hypothetical protein